MKTKVQKTNAMRLLDTKGYQYETHTYAWKEDELDALHVGEGIGKPNGQIFKTLVAVGDKTGPIVAIVPSEKELDLKKIAKASGNKKVEMLHLRDLEKTTGYIRGGCSPIGMKKLFPTYLAEEALEWETIIFSAGKRGQQIELSPQELLEVTAGEAVDLTKER